METLPFISFVTFITLLTNSKHQFLILLNGDDSIYHRVLMFIKRKSIVNTPHRLWPEQVISGSGSFLGSEGRECLQVCSSYEVSILG